MCDRETYYQQVIPVDVSLRDYHTSPVSLGRVLILIPNVYVRPGFLIFFRGEIVRVLYVHLASLFRGFI